MDIPIIGAVTLDADLGWYYSEPMPFGVLGGELGRIVLDGYDDDPDKDQIHEAIRNFLGLDQSALRAVDEDVFKYYTDCNEYWSPGDDEYLVIASPSDVWAHVRLGTDACVTRRTSGDKGVYISLECECEWEIEHGLQIVFKDGLRINKVGSFDDHVTNADAYGDPRLEDVVYVGQDVDVVSSAPSPPFGDGEALPKRRKPWWRFW